MVDPLLERFRNGFDAQGVTSWHALRMIVLYDQSVAFKGLVVGTSNKTEILLGFPRLG